MKAPWTCDACRQPIRRVGDGWVEWVEAHLDRAAQTAQAGT